MADERVIRLETNQQHLIDRFAEHVLKDAESFEKISTSLTAFQVNQATIKTTIWMAGAFISLLVPFLVLLLNKVF